MQAVKEEVKLTTADLIKRQETIPIQPAPVVRVDAVDAPIAIHELPKSTMIIKRVSLREKAMMDPDSFVEKKVIGQGTFG